jgi:transposase
MSIVGGLDLHRQQITFDYLDTESGQVSRGRVVPADREHLRVWLRRVERQEAAFAVEACTGWRFVVEELERAGARAHLAEPGDTAALRGPKRRAKTDRTDARHLRELLMAARLPESWIPPSHVSDTRTQIRLYKALVDERTAWLQRVHAILFQHGAPAVPGLARASGRARLDPGALPAAARSAVEVALRSVDRVNEEIDALRAELNRLARAQSGCRALQAHYGIGPLTSVAIWAELGDCRRFSSSSDAVRHTGLDVTVHSSDTRRARGRLARQGPGVLRWALFEAAVCAARPASPDHAYYLQVRARLGHQRAVLSVARKLARWSHHTLRALGDQALAPA